MLLFSLPSLLFFIPSVSCIINNPSVTFFGQRMFPMFMDDACKFASVGSLGQRVWTLCVCHRTWTQSLVWSACCNPKLLQTWRELFNGTWYVLLGYFLPTVCAHLILTSSVCHHRDNGVRQNIFMVTSLFWLCFKVLYPSCYCWFSWGFRGICVMVNLECQLDPAKDAYLGDSSSILQAFCEGIPTDE